MGPDYKIYIFDKPFEVSNFPGNFPDINRKKPYLIDYSDLFRHKPRYLNSNADCFFYNIFNLYFFL